jgi:hypothetical protein
LDSVLEVEVDLFGLSLSVDADHLAGVLLVGETHESTVLADSLLNELLVLTVGLLMHHRSSVFGVVESASVGVNGSVYKFLNHRLVTLFEDYNQLRDELEVIELLNLIQVDRAAI